MIGAFNGKGGCSFLSMISYSWGAARCEREWESQQDCVSSTRKALSHVIEVKKEKQLWQERRR